MENRLSVSRVQLIYALCLPLAVLMGYFLADPTDPGSIGLVLAVVGVLSIPILMRWYHPILVLVWNAAINPFFLPGRPYLWMLLAIIGLIFAVANRFTSVDAKFVVLPSINKPLLALLLIVIATAWLQGGIGIRTLGGTKYGGKGYFYILAAIAGYFTLSSQRIPASRAKLFVSLFFLMGVTSLVPNLTYLAGPKFEFLFYLFPADYALEQAMADYSISPEFGRIFGLSYTSLAVLCFLLVRYGLRGIFEPGKYWRVALFLGATCGFFFCGFRSFLLLFVIVLGLQVIVEGLLTWRLVLIGLAGLGISATLVLPNASSLPPVVQRTISFLPADISPSIRLGTQGSSQWRLEMWQELLPTIPQYLLKGKGYSIDPTEMSFVRENSQRGFMRSYEPALLSGDYHNGPLSLIIPFGLWGVIAFVWLIVVALKYLYRNYHEGDPSLKTVNTFLLVYFIARLIFFCGVFGSFYGDMAVFAGLLGLSASVNGSEPYKAPAQVTETEEEELFSKDFSSDKLPVGLR